MDHEAVCGCGFVETCQTHADALIDPSRKTRLGFGCEEQTDQYRSRHCKAFSCRYLSMLLSDILSPEST